MQAMPIVVGYDGSASSTKALEWAVAEARSRRTPLRIVHALASPAVAITGFGIYEPLDSELVAKVGEQTLASAVERVQEIAPELAVDTRLIAGAPAKGLLDNLDNAELVVGSTAVALATHARCPVIVLRDAVAGPADTLEAGRVVVGVDGSELSRDALAFAFEEASLRGAGLTALHAWEVPFFDVRGHGGPEVPDAMREFQGEEMRLLSESLAGWREKYPDVDVRQTLVHQEPVKALVDSSPGAALVVVGSRGRGGFRSMLLGSVSHALVHHARCPVAVVRPAVSPTPAS
jgi:nucleotide-binding universal stress UspA family protein